MATKCEQIDSALNILMDYDEPLKGKQLLDEVLQILGVGAHLKKYIKSSYYIEYKQPGKKSKALLVKAITYLGNPHPLYKKRIQIPSWWKEFYEVYKDVYDIRFVGVYHYDGMIVFSDFNIDRYVNGCAHNSSAHVYINDIYQAICHGSFKRVDAFGNIITSVSKINFRNYINGVQSKESLLREEIFDVFRGFNSSFRFNESLRADEVLLEMKNANFSKWKWAEWAGAYLEYKMYDYINRHNILAIVCFVKDLNKPFLPDFDLYFSRADFYGDLKSSDIKQSETPGNDKNTVLSCINNNGKVWYIIYEHDTIKDKDITGNPMTRFWNRLLGKEDELSYKERMKNSVTYRKMAIYEINRANMHEALRDFNQGRQPSGASRNTKVLIKKKDAENYIIFRG